MSSGGWQSVADRLAEGDAGAMIRTETELDFMTDDDLLAALDRAREVYDGETMDQLFDEVERRGLDL